MNYNKVFSNPIQFVLKNNARNLILKFSLFLSMLVMLILSGCVNQPTNKNTNLPLELKEVKNWFLKARIAIQSPEDNTSATLDWQKTPNNFDFHIYGLFGATYAHLIQTDNQAILKLPEDKIYYHHNAEQLLHEYLGWKFPIDSLSYWIKGLPSGQTDEKIFRDKNGQIENIIFQDWKIEFSRYQTYSNYIMPKMIKATHPEMTMKIVVKDWDFEYSDEIK